MHPRARWHLFAAFPLAALVAVASLGGLLFPSIYARETPNWAAQAIAQDWTDLIAATPLLLASAVYAFRGSRVAKSLLGGAFLYTVYSFVIYAFAVHFNTLFLVYCAALGISFFSVVTLIAGELDEEHASVRD
jgi:hypothetical protein